MTSTKCKESDSGQDISAAALPAAYADWRRSALGRITDRIEERLLLDRLGSVQGCRILDVGCGDAVMATRLAAAGAWATGLDASPGMIAAARRRAAAAGVELDLVQGDATRLPFCDASFDVVLSVAALCFVDDTRGAATEVVRVLKPGGRLVLGELGRWNSWAMLRRLKRWLGSPVWQEARFRSRGDLLAIADGAGLQDVSVAGAVFYPPLGVAARLMAPLDATIGRWISGGAAFLVLTGVRPREEEAEEQE